MGEKNKRRKCKKINDRVNMGGFDKKTNHESIIDYILLKYNTLTEPRKLPPYGESGLNILICPECNEAFYIGKFREHHYGKWKNLSRGKEKKVCIVCRI
jgi:hypothetical protein